MHGAEYQQHPSKLYTDQLNRALNVCRPFVKLQIPSNVSESDEVKAHNEKMVDRIGQGFIPVECIHQKGPAILYNTLATQMVMAVLVARYTAYAVIIM